MVIMIVEDNVAVRITLKFYLENEGYKVILAANGEEGLNKLRQGPLPNLILLDLMMPIMNGWEFMNRIEAEPLMETIPVVILTAINSSTLKLSRDRQVIQKPVNPDELLKVLETICV